MSRYVLDACALLAVLNKENGAEPVEDIIGRAGTGSARVSMNIVNLLEVYYGVFRKGGKKIADEMLLMVDASPIEVVGTISGDVLKEAGRLKASYKISVADSMALAEASVSDGILVTSDHHELNAVEASEKIKFDWFR
jgi:PIN domain nuclease of toxin-antitoxin system